MAIALKMMTLKTTSHFSTPGAGATPPYRVTIVARADASTDRTPEALERRWLSRTTAGSPRPAGYLGYGGGAERGFGEPGLPVRAEAGEQ